MNFMDDLVIEDKVRYALWQREACPDTGREHFQMWVVTKKAIRKSGMAKMMPGCHAEKQRGSDQECQDYCTKLESRVSEPQSVSWGFNWNEPAAWDNFDM